MLGEARAAGNRLAVIEEEQDRPRAAIRAGPDAPPSGNTTTGIRLILDVRGWVTVHAPGSMRFSIGSSTHGMAQRLRAMDLDDARPMLVLRTERFQSKLHPATRLS